MTQKNKLFTYLYKVGHNGVMIKFSWWNIIFLQKNTQTHNAMFRIDFIFYNTFAHKVLFFWGLAHFTVPSSKGVVASKKSWGHEGSVTITSMRWLVTEVIIANIFSS